MSNKYSQLTYEQRCQISVLIKSNLNQIEMAKLVGTSQSAISREIKRNSGLRGYRPRQAQIKADARRKLAREPTVMTPAMIEVINQKLRLKWSPMQISGWLLFEKQQLVSHESIYLHVWRDKKLDGTLYLGLRRQGKKYDKRRNGKSTRGQIAGRVSIDERPAIVDSKSRVGDWEIDTVIGKGHSGALVTIVERVTKFTLSKQVNSKSAADVTEATISLLRPFKDLVHTITADNGKEFSDHKKISKALSTKVYFANPYSSWERGLNENTNGLLRQYFPKNTDFKKVSQAEVRKAVRCLNKRPREMLNFKTPAELMAKHRAKMLT